MNQRILVVDNDADLEELLRQIFRDDPIDLEFFEGTEDIVGLVKQVDPTIVLLDYNLNGTNGGEMCKELKSNPETQQMPVILFSAFPKIIYSLENYGFDAFIEKPFDIDEILSTVRTMIKERIN